MSYMLLRHSILQVYLVLFLFNLANQLQRHMKISFVLLIIFYFIVIILVIFTISSFIFNCFTFNPFIRTFRFSLVLIWDSMGHRNRKFGHLSWWWPCHSCISRIFGVLLILLFFILSFSLLRFNGSFWRLWNRLLKLDRRVSICQLRNIGLWRRQVLLFVLLKELYLFTRQLFHHCFKVITSQNQDKITLLLFYISIRYIYFQIGCFI